MLSHLFYVNNQCKADPEAPNCYICEMKLMKGLEMFEMVNGEQTYHHSN